MDTIEPQIEDILFKYDHLEDDIDRLKTVISSNSMELNLINVSFILYTRDRIQSFFKENLNGSETFASSCMEYFDMGNRQNGLYKIRPSLTFHAFKVECLFTETEGITIIKALDWTNDGFKYPKQDEQRCLEPYCFNHSINYGIDIKQFEV